MHHSTTRKLDKLRQRKGCGWEKLIPGLFSLAGPILDRILPSPKKSEGSGFRRAPSKRRRHSKKHSMRRARGILAPVNSISAGPPV
jgi:hypothetical protein